MLSYLDRANIGNAFTAGMTTSLGLSSDQTQNLLTIFYVGYVVGQPCTVCTSRSRKNFEGGVLTPRFGSAQLLWKALQPRYFVAFLTLCWGTLALCQAAAKEWAGLVRNQSLFFSASKAQLADWRAARASR